MGILFNGKFGLRLDTCSSTDNTLDDSGRLLEKSGVLLQIEKTAESSDDNLRCHEFIVEDVVIHLAINDPSEVITIKK